LPTALQYVLFGLGALTYARNPEGILEYNKRKTAATMERIRSRRNKPGSPPAPVVATSRVPV
jgi:hypothetical protein